jgi:hypothetical protein
LDAAVSLVLTQKTAERKAFHTLLTPFPLGR